MSYFLRVEGVNLGSFVNDTADLATIRGGSLLLLEAMDVVEKKINEYGSGLSLGEEKERLVKEKNVISAKIKDAKRQQDNKLCRELVSELNEIKIKIKNCKNKAKSSGSCLATISKGASWGLFELDVDLKDARSIKRDVINAFNNDSVYKYATFVVDLYQSEGDEGYQSRRDKVQAMNRYQQLKIPSFAITNKGEGVCTLDTVTPAEKKRDLPADSGEKKRDYVSDSVYQRREYGRGKNIYTGFYRKITGIDGINPTKDLEQLSSNAPYPALNGKIAYIYIDGNKFGYMQRKAESVIEQRRFDQQTREGRERVLEQILRQIKDDPDWLSGSRLRLETLLWGGDEIVWVVPAWQGWWMLMKFYELAQDYIRLVAKEKNGREIVTPLYHGASIIFCKHNAPIHRINTLARSLADGFAKTKGFKKQNMIAYQVLESFDHAGTSLCDYRKQRLRGLSDNDPDLLIAAEQMKAIEDCIAKLKKEEFPRRKIYQIVQCWRENSGEKAEKLYQKIVGENRSELSPEQQREFGEVKAELEKLKTIFNGSNAYWLHLMELWDYVSPDRAVASESQEGG